MGRTMLRRRVPALVLTGAAVFAGACAQAASAASLRISSSADEAVAGRQLALTISGHADRDGSWALVAHRPGTPCGATAAQENQGNEGAPLGQTVQARENIAAGETFSDTVFFTPSSAEGVRFCALLGDYNQNGDAPPDARAQLLVCGSGQQVSGDRCVTPTTGSGTSGFDIDAEIPVSSDNGACAPRGRYTAIKVLRVNCGAAQHVQKAWRARSGCVPSVKHPTRSCSILQGYFRCTAKRSKSTGRIGVRCTRAAKRQVVRFTYRR